MKKQRTRNERRAVFIARVVRITACLVLCILVAGTLVAVSAEDQTGATQARVDAAWEK